MIKPNTPYPISKSQYFEKQRQDQDIISVRWRSQPSNSLPEQQHSMVAARNRTICCGNKTIRLPREGRWTAHHQQLPKCCPMGTSSSKLAWSVTISLIDGCDMSSVVGQVAAV
jgi:hypothetical protein